MAFFDFEYFLINSSIIEKEENCAVSNDSFLFVIRFENVPLVTPNGDVLIDDLSFEVKILLSAFSSFPLIYRLSFQ